MKIDSPGDHVVTASLGEDLKTAPTCTPLHPVPMAAYVRASIALILTVLSAGLSIGCASTDMSLHSASPENASTPVVMPGPRIHSYAKAFVDFWNQVEQRPETEQVARFKSEFAPHFQDFYDYKFEKWKERGKNPDEELANQLGEFPRLKATFIKKADELARNLDSNLTTFLATLPDMNRDFDVYVIHSLGDMDGGVRKIGDKNYFILGIDGMVRYHDGFKSESPFFHHELYHLYQKQFVSSKPVVWMALWAEGLATYASKVLNPDASNAELLLNAPKGMVKAIDRKLAFHLQDLASKLQSGKEEDYITYFLISSKNKKITPRAGYYLGYLLAKDIANETNPPRDLGKLAKMQPAETLTALRRVLAKRLKH